MSTIPEARRLFVTPRRMALYTSSCPTTVVTSSDMDLIQQRLNEDEEQVRDLVLYLENILQKQLRGRLEINCTPLFNQARLQGKSPVALLEATKAERLKTVEIYIEFGDTQFVTWDSFSARN